MTFCHTFSFSSPSIPVLESFTIWSPRSFPYTRHHPPSLGVLCTSSFFYLDGKHHRILGSQKGGLPTRVDTFLYVNPSSTDFLKSELLNNVKL